MAHYGCFLIFVTPEILLSRIIIQLEVQLIKLYFYIFTLYFYLRETQSDGGKLGDLTVVEISSSLFRVR